MAFFPSIFFLFFFFLFPFPFFPFLLFFFFFFFPWRSIGGRVLLRAPIGWLWDFKGSTMLYWWCACFDLGLLCFRIGYLLGVSH